MPGGSWAVLVAEMPGPGLVAPLCQPGDQPTATHPGSLQGSQDLLSPLGRAPAPKCPPAPRAPLVPPSPAGLAGIACLVLLWGRHSCFL